MLDQKAYKIYKFSPNGKLLLSFGNKGEGPGDMQRPHYIRLTPENCLAVCEEIGYVSFFDAKGNFLKRNRVPKGLELTYINNNLYYGWEWKRKSKQQVLVNHRFSQSFNRHMNIRNLKFVALIHYLNINFKLAPGKAVKLLGIFIRGTALKMGLWALLG